MKLFKNKFGKKPDGERLEKIKRSPNYKNGQFQNLNHTPPFAEDHSLIGVMYDRILEKDWHESIDINQRSRLFVEPARHFSGRGFKRNNTLWVSYVLQTPSLNIYLGGDSGYDNHYLNIGNKYGPFDLAILENGQYNPAWPYIHQSPDELLKAARDLKTERIFPVHNSKFTLSNHPWYDPMARLTELNKDYNFELVTPLIGEVVNLDDTTQVFKQWWADME